MKQDLMNINEIAVGHVEYNTNLLQIPGTQFMSAHIANLRHCLSGCDPNVKHMISLWKKRIQGSLKKNMADNIYCLNIAQYGRYISSYCNDGEAIFFTLSFIRCQHHSCPLWPHFRWIFENEKFCILIKFSLTSVLKVQLTKTQHWFR